MMLCMSLKFPDVAENPRPPMPHGIPTRKRGDSGMADQIAMAKYWRQYQAAEIKANRARVELEKLKNTMQHSAGAEDLLELQGDCAYSLAMTGQPRQKVAESRKVEWFTPWGSPISKK